MKLTHEFHVICIFSTSTGGQHVTIGQVAFEICNFPSSDCVDDLVDCLFRTGDPCRVISIGRCMRQECETVTMLGQKRQIGDEGPGRSANTQENVCINGRVSDFSCRQCLVQCRNVDEFAAVVVDAYGPVIVNRTGFAGGSNF